MVNTTLLLLVKDDLEGLAAVLLGAGALADNLDGVDKVAEDGVVDSSQSARAGTLLGLVGARVDGALRAGKDTALSDEEDVAVRELLLQLAGQAVVVKNPHVSSLCSFLLRLMQLGFCSVCSFLPLLDLVETLEKGDGDEDDNGLLAVANLNLLEKSSQYLMVIFAGVLCATRKQERKKYCKSRKSSDGSKE